MSFFGLWLKKGVLFLKKCFFLLCITNNIMIEKLAQIFKK